MVTCLMFGAWIAFGRRKTKPQTNAQQLDIEDRSSQQLQELAKLTGELVHEIKNPLSTLKLNLKLVQEQFEAGELPMPEAHRAQRKLAIIQDEADRLDKLLTSFLSYVRQPELQWRTVSLSELVADVVDFYSPQAIQNQVTLRQGYAAETLHVRIDVEMFKQVLLNMFINAQQAMPEGGELMIATRRQEKNALVQISDTGCGIPADRLPRLFTPYFSTRRKGTGLGLATAQKIMTLFGGTISVDSEPGQGSSFTIGLPLHRLETAAQEVHD